MQKLALWLVLFERFCFNLYSHFAQVVVNAFKALVCDCNLRYEVSELLLGSYTQLLYLLHLRMVRLRFMLETLQIALHAFHVAAKCLLNLLHFLQLSSLLRLCSFRGYILLCCLLYQLLDHLLCLPLRLLQCLHILLRFKLQCVELLLCS